MSLEERVAYWVDLGLTEYLKTYDLQVNIAHLRRNNLLKEDIILTTEHRPEVNFGSAEQHNQFSEEFLDEVRKLKGQSFTKEDIIEVLKSKDIAFSKTSRGGGATVIAPGQIIFYPVVDYEKVVGKVLGVGDYKNLIDRILYNVISKFNVPNLAIAQGLIQTSQGVRERRDVWTNIEGHDFKIGSKGIHNAGNIAYHGFVIYADIAGTKLFDYIKPCGYSHDEVSVISIEEITGKQVDKELIKELTKAEIKEKFRYSKITELSKEELFEMLDKPVSAKVTV